MAWLKMIATVFHGHTATHLTSATTLRTIADAFKDQLSAERVAQIRGTAITTVLDMHHRLQRMLWSKRLSPKEATQTAELLGEFLGPHLEEHAAAVTPLRTALAWDPTLLRARFNLATAYTALGDTNAADKHFAVCVHVCASVCSKAKQGGR